jgi:hypothetical protein
VVLDDPEGLITASESTVEGKQTVVLSAKNLKRRTRVANEAAPHLWWPRALVRIGDYLDHGEKKHSPKTPAEVSKAEYSLAASRLPPTDDIRKIHRTVLAAMPEAERSSARERARALYAWVQENIQYCALYETTMGGWVPHDVATIVQQRSGDCKDKAAILSSLLSADGTKSRLAVIYSHDGYPRKYEIPALIWNFNHMILIADFPDGSVTLDPTTRAVPFGLLPTGDQGADLLPISEKGDDLIVTPVDPPEKNLLTIAYDVAVDDPATGYAAGTVHMELYAAHAEDFRSATLAAPPRDHPTFVQKLLELPASVRLTNVRMSNLGYNGKDTAVVIDADVDGLELVAGGKSPRAVLLTTALTGAFRERFPDDGTTGPTTLSFLSKTKLSARVRVKGFQLPSPVATDVQDFPAYMIKSYMDAVKSSPEVYVFGVEMDRKRRVIKPGDIQALKEAMMKIDEETAAAFPLARIGASP